MIKQIFHRIRRRLLSPNLRQITENIGWLFFDKILRMGVGFFAGVWVARYLGPDQYGILNYAQAIVSIFAFMAGLGLDSITVRALVKETHKLNEILGTSFGLRLCGGFISILIIIIAIAMIPAMDKITQAFILIIALGAIFQAFDVIDFWFQAHVRSKYTVYAKNGAFLLATIIKVILILTNAPLIAFAWVGLGEIIFGSLGMIFAYQLSGSNIKYWTWNAQRSKTLLSASWPLIISGLVVSIYMRIDQIILRELMGNAAVGVYSVTVKLSEVWYVIPGIITTSLFPGLIQTKTRNYDEYINRLQFLYNAMVLLGVAIAIVITCLSNVIVSGLYGKAYLSAGAALCIQIWAGVFVALGGAAGPWILNEGLVRYSLVATSIGAAANMVFNLILIPYYGILGASITTLLSQMFANYIVYGLLRRTRILFIMLTRALLFIDIIEYIKRLWAKRG